MSAPVPSRRAVAEIDFGDVPAAAKIGNRSIHQFWHLFSSHFRFVLLAPQRRPDSGRVAWTWREPGEHRPVTATELADVRRRLAEAATSLSGGYGELDREEEERSGAAILEGQVRSSVAAMVGQLVTQRDAALLKYVCRTDGGTMLHSWGAATAAEPFYPDAQNGEIGGSVAVGGERPAGLSLVLENPQGAGIAHTKSDQSGEFRFPSVAPGRYLIRVLDRSDFPADGLEVTMGRDSITGLELRAQVAPSQKSDVARVTADQQPPARRRKLVAILALLLLLAGGYFYWQSKGAATPSGSDRPTNSGWQSATGQVEGEAKKSDAEKPKVGADGAWTTLSKTVAAPKLLIPAGPGKNAPGEGSTEHGPSSTAADETNPGGTVKQSNGARPDAGANEKRPGPGVASRSPSAERGGPAVSVAGAPAEEQEAHGPENTKTEPAARSSANPAGLEKAKKRLIVDGAAVAAEEELTSPLGESSDAQARLDSENSASGATKGKPGQPKTTKSARGSGSASVASAAGEDLPTGTADSGSAPTAGPASSSAKSAAAQSSKSQSGAGAAPSPANASADTPDSSTVPDSSAEPTSVDPSPGTNAAKKVQTKKPAPNSTAPSSEPENSPAKKPEDEPAASVTAKPKAQPAKPSHARPSDLSTAKAEATAVASAQSEPAAAEATDTTASAESRLNSPKGTAPLSRKTPPANSATAAKVAPSNPIPNSATGEGAVGAVHSTEASGDSLRQVGEIRAGPWRARLIQDLIVPTRPVTAAEEEALEAMRTQMLREREVRMNPAFREPRLTTGIALRLDPRVVGEKGSLGWRDESGAEIAGATVADGRAEIGWTGSGGGAHHVFQLIDASGRTLARIATGPTGNPTVKVSAGVAASYWVGIETAARSGRPGEVESANEKLEWRSLAGARLPDGWVRDDHWREGRGHRIDLPLKPAAGESSFSLALVDPFTGWALASQLSLR